MAKKSYFGEGSNAQSKPAEPAQKGDLNGDGKVDWLDSLLGVVMFIQTPRGQAFIIIAAAVFSAAINISSYSKSVEWLLKELRSEWLIPFIWVIALTIWAVIQVGEVLPRTGFWDFETKVAIVKSLQGAGVPLKDYDPKSGQQTDMVYWQDATINDAKNRRLLFWSVSILAHLADVAMLWSDYPLVSDALLPIAKHVLIAAFLMFSFEFLVGIAQSLKQLRKGYSVQ